MHNTSPKKHALLSKPLPTPPRFTPAQLLRWFLLLLPGRTVCQLPALQHQTFYHRLFTPLVTLWYLLFQRLNPDHTLDAALADARAGGADRLNRKLSRHLASAATASYSDARQRLPWPWLAELLGLQGRRLTQLSPTARWHGWLVSLLDGSTVRLRPYGTIPKAFPPHGNQHQKRTYWCLMRVVVSFCGRTGAALDCALGSSRQSEQALGSELMLRARGRGLFLGDRNFGVFRIVQAARQNHQQVLLRLTQVRARKLLGRALASGDHAVTWQPTRHDQLLPTGNPAPVPGRLIAVRLQRPGFRSQWLYLFTTLTDPTRYPLAELVQLYGVRWHIELDLRYVKAQMGAAQLEAHSADMARKEWLASLLAYNLIRAAMLAAALQQGLPPLTLSFSAARRRLERWLRDYGRTQTQTVASWQNTLEAISQCRLPHRLLPRPAEPRAQRYVGKTYPPLVGSRAKARKNLQFQTLKS